MAGDNDLTVWSDQPEQRRTAPRAAAHSQIHSTNVNEPDEVLYRSGSLSISRTQVWVSGKCFPLSSVSTIQCGKINYWHWMVGWGLGFIVIGAIAVSASWLIGSDASSKLHAIADVGSTEHGDAVEEQVASQIAALIGLPLLSMGIFLLILGIKGKKRFVLTITANSGQSSRVRFKTEQSFQRAAAAMSQAIAGVGRSTVVNAIFMGKR